MRTQRAAAVLASLATAATAVVTVGVVALLPPSPAGAIDADAALVISEVYGGGGNAGATFTHDYVEVFNRSAEPAMVTDWSVQYASATGTGNFVATTFSATIPAGGRILVQLASNGAVGAPLPIPDVTGTTNMSSSSGKVALVDQAAGLGCNGGSTPCSAEQLGHLRDLVGYGTANFFEGTGAAPSLSNATAALRGADGCTDTNQNGIDVSAGPPAPRNGAATATPCGGPGNQLPTVTVPATLTTPAGTPANAEITAADADGTVESLAATAPAVLPAGITFTSTGPATGTLAVDATAARATTVITFTATDDQGGVGSATTTVEVTSLDPCGTGVTHQIAEVQGAGVTSPLVGATVRIEGIVTGDFQAPGLVGGFYLQDDTPDADAGTSDGVLVFNSTIAVSPGQRVRVTGRVTEFRRAGDTLPDTVTELTSTSSVTPCGTGTIEPTPLLLPFENLERRESLEGVLVDVPAGLTATELFGWARFGEVAVAEGGRLYNPTNGQGGTAEENDRRRILLDDARTTQNPPSLAYLRTDRTIPRLGDTLARPLTGVFTYEFDQYRVQPTEPVVDTVLFDAAGPRPSAPEQVGGDLRVSTFNTLNYFTTVDTPADQGAPGSGDEPRGADTADELTRQRDKLLPALLGLDADVLGLVEIENSAAGALADLVTRLNDLQPGTTDDYAIVAEPDLGLTPNAYGGAFGTDLIKVAIIYRPAVVSPVGDAVSSADPIHNRPPLAQTFELVSGSEPFTMVMNHFKSKGSCPAPGTDPANEEQGQGCWNALRRQQATAVLDLVEAEDLPNAVILGDLNAYGEEDPVGDIEAAGWTNVSVLAIPLADRYSFVFEGESGELDHALLPSGFTDRLTGADIWHINSDEPSGADYNDFNTGQAIDGDPIYTADPFRSSDHDPLLFGLDLRQPPGALAAVTATPGWSATTVSWSPPASGGPASGYTVRALTGAVVVAEVAVAAGQASVTLGPLDHGVAHTIEVVAVNDDGTSPITNATVTPGRIPRGRFLVATGSCPAPGSRRWTVSNPHAVAVGFNWLGTTPVTHGDSVVAAAGSVTIDVPTDSRPFGAIALISGDRLAGGGVAGRC